MVQAHDVRTNYINIVNLCHHSVDHGVNSEWYFYTTSLGKSSCDGIGRHSPKITL